jgi:glycolate oxidase
MRMAMAGDLPVSSSMCNGSTSMCREARADQPGVLKDDVVHDGLIEARAVEAGARQVGSGEHGVGVAKKEFLPKFLGDASMRVMRGLRRELDPQGILNPGKMFDME